MKNVSYLEVRVFQGLVRCQSLLRVHGEHLGDQIFRLGADVCPVFVVEAVHALLDFGEQPRLQVHSFIHSFAATSKTPPTTKNKRSGVTVKNKNTRFDIGDVQCGKW